MTYTADDGDAGNYYLACGCWSGQSDHTCRVGGWQRPDDCHCGAPDDCYCHESCGTWEEACPRHRAEFEQEFATDHAEAIRENVRRDREDRQAREDAAVTRLTAGKRARVVRVQAYTDNGNRVHVLTNGRDYVDIRPRECLHGNTRRAAVALARMVLAAVPGISHVQIWDASSGSNVWGIGDNDNGRWFVAYDSEANGTPITEFDA